MSMKQVEEQREVAEHTSILDDPNIVDLEYARIWREIGDLERVIDAAVSKATRGKDMPKGVTCPLCGNWFEITIKRIGERGDCKVQYFCDTCGFGAEGWSPAGRWANRASNK